MAQPSTAKFGKMRVLLGAYPTQSVALVSISNANPPVVTVAPADIGKFNDSDEIDVKGATGDMVAANGVHMISNVGATTFNLVGVDLSAAAAPATTGLSADVADYSGAIIYGAPCGLTTKGLTISKNLQEVSIPDCDAPDAPIWLGRDVQNISAQISGDGVAAGESVPDWNSAAISTMSVPMRVEIEFDLGQKSFEGDFVVDNLTFAAEAGGRVTLSFNAQSDGVIQDLWVPAA